MALTNIPKATQLQTLVKDVLRFSVLAALSGPRAGSAGHTHPSKTVKVWSAAGIKPHEQQNVKAGKTASRDCLYCRCFDSEREFLPDKCVFPLNSSISGR
jgi:hypothetical protein